MRRRELLKNVGLAPLISLIRYGNSPATEPAQSSLPASLVTGEHQCYTDEWLRTRPDLVVYLPRQPDSQCLKRKNAVGGKGALFAKSKNR